MLEPSIQFSIY